MYGSIAGNIIAILYFMYFQIAGLIFAGTIFRKENFPARLLLGSVMGSLMATWLPILAAFLFDFTVTAHVASVVVTIPFIILTLLSYRKQIKKGIENDAAFSRNKHSTGGSGTKAVLTKPTKEHMLFFAILAFFLVFWCYLLHTHTILPNEDGGIYTGQCTYGDMNMHLGFITSLAVQGTFPPDYSIMPGVRLSYPFLSDSISSSLYVFESSLRLAYILPMVFAMAQIVTSVYVLANTLYSSLRKSMLTLTFFFLNGGLGFVYFIDWASEGGYTFSDIFTGFYTTPTNLIGHNIRWVNVIADMFLPQRATLFGYAALFPALWLLYRAVFQGEKKYFPVAGLIVAALPMIHTHSFLSAGIISAAWLLLWLYKEVHNISDTDTETQSGNIHPPVHHTGTHKKPGHRSHARHGLSSPWFTSKQLARTLLAAFLIIMCLLQARQTNNTLSTQTLIAFGVSLFVAAVIYGIYLLFFYIKKYGLKELLHGWVSYLLPILLLALPQLLFWTFGQVAQGSFVRGHFNWGNLGDNYLWFYLKNIGVICFLIVGSILACNRKKASLFLPVLFLWWLGELIVFTPNTYDNNKLLYVAYLLLCLGAADYAVELYDKLKDLPGRRIFAGIFLFCSVFSAILTLGRETVSNYQLYNPSQVALAEYVEENLAPDAVLLTNTRHNNEIPSLTGRNIVCGADTFLYYHGLDTTQRKNDLKLMYEAPLENLGLYEKYGVDYVVISGFERNSYQVDKAAFDQQFTAIFTYKDVTLYEVK